MAYQVTWSNEAVQDLEEIAEYISNDSPLNAIRVITKFYHSIGIFSKYPKAASAVPEINSITYYQKLIYGWRVIYKVDEVNSTMTIIAIIHGRRLFDSIQGRFINDDLG